MYAIYSNKGISPSDRDRRHVLESRSNRQRRGPTTTNNNPKIKSSSIVLLPPYSYNTTSSSSSFSSNNDNNRKKKNNTTTNNNKQERQLQIAVDDLLQEHQDEIQRPKPRCTIHHRDSFSTISTRASILTSSQHHCQVKGEKRCGEFIIPTEISFSSSSSSLHSVPSSTTTKVDYTNIPLGSNHSNNSNNSKIKKSSKHLPDFPDSNVIFDLYADDDDDDIMFIPPVVVEKDLIIASTIRSRELRMRKQRIIKRRESMGIINSAPAPSLPLRRKEMDQLSIGMRRFEI
ncbi:hypothetical protein FRACYDRAFT_233464 [Fragilariopsis cylindrus CCMP1102]|uniref:Uncharacterized protein n=1 Tax=Fragilariopsis cylindrus CCMP1102 TaxID=635003 RepID=A0A1E7FYR1_9STRA|nr:hypothetical protein FRACYDRAFT_233464 [Fragilariopsis cylindrus CCMP1102]|eukprot:OEU23291.1 hypothetical protein FRACYDRAFT_233464 [Fragilariopsis cylindrus CCMP1102]